MRVDVGYATDVGKVRHGNEDAYLVDPPLFAVADGMGGHRGGDVASQLALETVEQLFHKGKTTLAEQIREANKAVFERSQQDKKVTGMGTTLTAALVDDDAVRLAHVGDSRAYLWRAGALRLLTDDHTLVARMVKAGEITEAEAETHPHRNVLTRALGTEPTVRVDEDQISLLDGDRLLLCSDGLTGMATEGQIQAILGSTSSPQDAADRLVRAANRAGGIDNITVVVLEFHDDDAPPGSGAAGRSAAGGGLRSRMRILGRSRSLRPSAPSVRRWLFALGAAVVVLAALTFGGRAYLDRQWYVGEADGHVTVFRGIPATPLGVHLNSVVFESDVSAAAADALPLYCSKLSRGLPVDNRDQAFALVGQIRTDIVAAHAGGTAESCTATLGPSDAGATP
jgi:PPM family protein phosphatase